MGIFLLMEDGRPMMIQLLVVLCMISMMSVFVSIKTGIFLALKTMMAVGLQM